MTIEQAIVLLAAFIASVLVGYILMMLVEWRREDKPVDGHWEIGCCIRTAHDPHHFLPGTWRVRAHYDDGTSEWERFA